MCGIAARIFGRFGEVGRDLVELMDAPVHRGAGSTGFGLYAPPLEAGFVIRAVAFDRSHLNSEIDDPVQVIRQFGADLVEGPTSGKAASRHVSVGMVVTDFEGFPKWS